METEEPANHLLLPLTKSASRLSLDDNISWFHGKVSREEAEHILETNGNEEGLFLVRESSSSPGDYVLSLIHEHVPVHYQIRRHGEDAFFSIDDGPIVHGLEMLINFYQKEAQGLSAKLGQMCHGQLPPSDTRRHGRTNLLHRATKESEITVVKELLMSGYHNLDAKNQDGQTAVHLASIMGVNDILELLLTVGANSNIVDGSGLTPLHYAAINNHAKTVKVLIDHGANPQSRVSETGWVPLHYAAFYGFTDAVTMLLCLKAPCYPRSYHNETPLDLAKKNDHKECILILENHVQPEPCTSKSAWFHESLTRKRTVELFQEHGSSDGMFLVRKSPRRTEMYVLSVVQNGHVFNYEIQCKDKFYFIDDGPYLSSLEHVIDYYSQFADGLPVNLQRAISSSDYVPEKNFKEPITDDKKSIAIEGGQHEVSVPHSATVRRKYDLNLIATNSIALGSVIGEGEFGIVRHGSWVNKFGNKVDVAVKITHDEHVQSYLDEFIREVEVMVALDHCCIVKLLGVSLGPPLMMVQELVPMGSLLEYILNNSSEIHIDNQITWVAQVAWGMAFLESRRFVHRDLAARNILLSSTVQAKISDFGLSRALGADCDYYKATSGGRWPVKWYAPECINFGNFSHASDVWSYGVTLWEIFSNGQHPYDDMNGQEVIEMIEAKKRLDIPSCCPTDIKILIERCWLYDPNERPTFKLLYESFCKNIAYCKLWKYFKEDVVSSETKSDEFGRDE